MMKTLSKLAVPMVMLSLLGCGGGSSDDSTETSNRTVAADNSNDSTNTTALKCDRGILLNSNLSATSIYDDSLYQLGYLQIGNAADSSNFQEGLYGEKITRSGQMLYANYLPIYNLTLNEIESDDAGKPFNYILNASGLYTTKDYQKQNDGWPVSYLTTSNNLNLEYASFNDTCNFTANNVKYSYKVIDLSGKKIKDILPNNIATTRPSTLDYVYVHRMVGYILSNNKTGLNALLNSEATFPTGSIVYVPQSGVYDDNQISFNDDDYVYDDVTSIDEWITKYSRNNTYKKDTLAGFEVAYTVDAQGNPIFSAGGDPVILKDGKIYDGEWHSKGNIFSPTYGVPELYPEYGFINYQNTGNHTLFNKTSYDFIAAQIQAYYK